MAQHGHLTRKEKKIIRQKRRILRRDLKKRGIRSRAEFETIAQQMGLVYSNMNGPLGWFWRFLDAYGILAIAALIALALAILSVVYIYAAMNKSKEDYTIALSGNLQRIGFDLSETEDFENPQVRLTATPVKDANAMSIADLPEGLDDAEGEHNGQDYLAYTFWIRNNGEMELAYDWQMQLLKTTTDVLDALWIMIFDEGKQIVYARAPEGHSVETLVGYSTWPQYDSAANPALQYYDKDGKKGIATTAFLSKGAVAGGTVENFGVGDKHKYTVVMWVEGDDPECTNSNLTGTVSFAFKFAVHADGEGSIFDDFIYDEEDFIKEEGAEEHTRALIPNVD